MLLLIMLTQSRCLSKVALAALMHSKLKVVVACGSCGAARWTMVSSERRRVSSEVA